MGVAAPQQVNREGAAGSEAGADAARTTAGQTTNTKQQQLEILLNYARAELRQSPNDPNLQAKVATHQQEMERLLAAARTTTGQTTNTQQQLEILLNYARAELRQSPNGPNLQAKVATHQP